MLVCYTPVGLLGDGRWPFKSEKWVRNPYGGPIKKNACDGEMVDAAAGEAVGLC